MPAFFIPSPVCRPVYHPGSLGGMHWHGLPATQDSVPSRAGCCGFARGNEKHGGGGAISHKDEKNTPHGSIGNQIRRGCAMVSRSGQWPRVRRIAWERDRKNRAPCHICGQPINYFLKPSSCDEAWEPDHVLPVARFPEAELDLNNIKASHMRCNRARGDGTNGENIIGMQSRVW